MNASRAHREAFLRAFDEPAAAAWANDVLALVIGQDGSTTRLLETIAGGSILVRVLDQRVVHALPAQLQGVLPPGRFLRRLTSLEAHGHVLLDSLSYIALDTLPGPVTRELQEGSTPIGKVLSSLWTRRSFRSQDTALFEELWNAVGCPDPHASRSCCIHTPAGPCMVLAETFRRGVLNLLPATTPRSQAMYT